MNAIHIFFRKIYDFACKCLQVLCLLTAVLLFAGGFLFTCYSTDMTSQQVLTRFDDPLRSLLWTALSAGFMVLVSCLADKMRARNTKAPEPCTVLTILVLFWYLAAGAAFVLYGKTVPAADAMSVYKAAQELASGNTAVIHPTESYLSYYPQQVGLTAFFEVLIRILHLVPTGLPDYHFIKCLYVLLACAAILLQRETVKLLWQDRRAELFYLIAAGFHLPFLMYTSFVYGEIPSFAALSAGLYFLCRLHCKKPASRRRIVLCALAALFFLTFSVMLRKNNLILIIAVVIVTLLQGLRDGKKTLLVFSLLCALGGISILPSVQKIYELRAENVLRSGVPAISYLAMGMQEAPRANGWYNGFNFNTYRDTGMDTAKTAELSRRAINERLETFQKDPAYAVDFYFRKHLSQWADGTYASRQATLATFGGRTDFFASLYEGKYSRFFIEYSNIYQNVLYLGVLLYCIASFRRSYQNGLPEALGLIGVIGGLLFHTFWEANSRYILPYSLLLMPYCARGISLCADVSGRIVRTKFRNKTCRS